MARPQKHYREALAAARDAAAGTGLEVTLDYAGGRHPARIVVAGAGRRQPLTISSSPRDRDICVRNVVQELRRLCREWGIP